MNTKEITIKITNLPDGLVKELWEGLVEAAMTHGYIVHPTDTLTMSFSDCADVNGDSLCEAMSSLCSIYCSLNTQKIISE